MGQLCPYCRKPIKEFDAHLKKHLRCMKKYLTRDWTEKDWKEVSPCSRKRRTHER